jgi:hypothetical protein
MSEDFWGEIDGFNSPMEFERFESWLSGQIAMGAAVEVAVVRPYSGNTLNERWFRNETSREIWRLVDPEPPFYGLFEKVN